MSQRISENIIICLDVSRSMYRRDYAPNRLESCKKALQVLISARLKNDPSTSFALITISDNPKLVLDFNSDEETIINNLYNIEFGGKSALGDALALGIQKIINELRKIGAKIPRVLVISDGNYTKTSIDPLKMANLASKLKITIDTMRLGELTHLNLLKRLSEITNGQYYYNTDTESMMDSARVVAESNIWSNTMQFKSTIENPAFMRKIAASLLRTQDLTKDQQERIKQIRGEVNYKKCTICFTDICPYCSGTFFTEGRYCPECNIPMHLHCATAYAASLKDENLKQSGTFRCPHCYFLLKIPMEVQQISKLKALRKPPLISSSDKNDIVDVKKMSTTELGDESLYKSCPVCNLIFEEKQDVIKCGNYKCNALYHINCFLKLENSRCKSCAKELRFIDEEG